MNRLLDAPAPAGQALGLDGLPAAAAELEGLLAGRRDDRAGRPPAGRRAIALATAHRADAFGVMRHAPRVLFLPADGRGLGHMSRTGKLAQAIRGGAVS